ncbi:MAG: YifB family Mg chelatase-like AAA ATPase [bacterium]|nr:YifB family Mg chelatase-like AAA ATPase [bacterium]
MMSRVLSCATLGIDAYIVHIETDLDRQLPAFSVVGLPDNAVKESRDRVTAAIRNTGRAFPNRRVTVNMAPADIRKEGSSFDLPIAVGILAAAGDISPNILTRYAILGELSLDGLVRPIRGVLPMAVEARRAGLQGLILPRDNAREAAIVGGLDVHPVDDLLQTLEFLEGYRGIEPTCVDIDAVFRQALDYRVDFRDVRGQEHAKRALEVAAAGGHNIIMLGPPGSGKTMLARRIPTVLPDLTLDEALEATKIHSVAGLLPPDTAVVAARPFRSPHHTISDAGLIGGGPHPRPGEVSLAHHGVLFLDELPEFKKNVLEVLRQPLEDGFVTIARAAISLTYPAQFMLACAMNPCPCGYFGDPKHECTCSPPFVQRYMARISGPLLDRIDIHIEIPAVEYEELSGKSSGDTSATVRERVNSARQLQLHRFREKKHLFCNAHMGAREIRDYCRITGKGEELLKMAITRLGLSARAYDRILKVSRTIADMECEIDIQPQHVAEAIQYRSLDRNLWM